MKSVGNVLTILSTIFVPAFVVIFILGVPPIVQILIGAAYVYCLYKIIKQYMFSKILIWNGYCYWYLKSLLNTIDFKAVVYSLSIQDHVKLHERISSGEYEKVLDLIPEEQRLMIEQVQKDHFNQRIVKTCQGMGNFTHKRA
ncbi:hypothetical protein [Companilactobacillus ginsenosidimutans]|uniref:Uncharacterized protein n=1 Tax=Companilactobacillus ginsenosidimutans TaxID=1007676 RepID=A0A0H4R0V9_9LACO|nr:hypothetical protein [Companilactobacillus ginsenosidimutans]AKP67360.1 hypothetical protein ABM34_07285 [Companilactobacillus ginsenosidimutans]